MNRSEKSSQVVGVTSEELDRIKLNDGNHKHCDVCGTVIRIDDNYCSYCGKPNNSQTKQRAFDLKISLISLLISIVVLVITLSS